MSGLGGCVGWVCVKITILPNGGSKLSASSVWSNNPSTAAWRFKRMRIRQNELKSPMIDKIRSGSFQVLLQEGWLPVMIIQTKLCLNNDAQTCNVNWAKWTVKRKMKGTVYTGVSLIVFLYSAKWMCSLQLMRFVFYVCNQQRQLTVMKDWTAFLYHQQVKHISISSPAARKHLHWKCFYH